MIRGICEPFAATAAVTRAILAGPNLPAPCGFMGAKQSMASTLILPAAGVRPGCGAERVVLADGGPWGEFWSTCRTPSGCRGVAHVLRGWRTERPTLLWDRLVSLAPLGGTDGVAQYLWIQARAASNTPTWWDGCRWGWGTSAVHALLYSPDLNPPGLPVVAWKPRLPLLPPIEADNDGGLFELPGPLSHGGVVARAVRWLRGHHRCRPVFAEISTYEPVTPDALGFRRDWSVLVEAKVSRSDFRADRDKVIHRHPDLCPGQERWYLMPPGMVRASEVPDGWGLAEVGARSIRVVVPAPIGVFSADRARADLRILGSAVRRHEVGAEWHDEIAKFEPYSSVRRRSG